MSEPAVYPGKFGDTVILLVERGNKDWIEAHSVDTGMFVRCPATGSDAREFLDETESWGRTEMKGYAGHSSIYSAYAMANYATKGSAWYSQLLSIPGVEVVEDAKLPELKHRWGAMYVHSGLQAPKMNWEKI
jgi:hypothetical protein